MPHCNKKNKQKRMKGGRVSLPIEYFGGESGRYSTNPQAPCANAYGATLARSMGTGNLSEGFVGPNMHVHPTTQLVQTGGKILQADAEVEAEAEVDPHIEAEKHIKKFK